MKVLIGLESLFFRHIYHISTHTENKTNQQHVLSTSCLNVQHTAEREKIFS